MRGVVVDANLLLLFIVGSYDARLVARFRRLKGHYAPSDFYRLIAYLQLFDKIVVTPHSLSETSNLLPSGDDDVAWGLRARYVEALSDFVEVYEPAKSLCMHKALFHLGLSDVAQICAAASSHELLTADGPLHSLALASGVKARHFAELHDKGD